MKTLILMRHAKSSWRAENIADHDRLLSARGRSAALAMGRWMKNKKIIPDLVLCSTAIRAASTLDILNPYLPHQTPIKMLRSLYMALPRQILATIIKTSVGKTSTILLIGHNPGIGSLAHWLSATGEPKFLRRMRDKFPTGAIAVIDFDISNWQELEKELGNLRTFKTPKSLSND